MVNYRTKPPIGKLPGGLELPLRYRQKGHPETTKTNQRWVGEDMGVSRHRGSLQQLVPVGASLTGVHHVEQIHNVRRKQQSHVWEINVLNGSGIWIPRVGQPISFGGLPLETTDSESQPLAGGHAGREMRGDPVTSFGLAYGLLRPPVKPLLPALRLFFRKVCRQRVKRSAKRILRSCFSTRTTNWLVSLRVSP